MDLLKETKDDLAHVVAQYRTATIIIGGVLGAATVYGTLFGVLYAANPNHPFVDGLVAGVLGTMRSKKHSIPSLAMIGAAGGGSVACDVADASERIVAQCNAAQYSLHH